MSERLAGLWAGWILALALTLAGAAADEAGEAQVALSLSTRHATVGDPIQARLVVKTAAAIERVDVTPPAGPFEVQGRRDRPPRRLGGERVFEQEFTLAFFAPGDFVVGPFRVVLFGAAREALAERHSETVAVHIRSLLGAEERDIGPLKPLPSLAGDPVFFLRRMALVAALPLLLIMLFWLSRRYRRYRRRPVAPPPPAEELAGRLRELQARRLLEQGEYRQFCVLLAEAFKHFLSRQYAFPAPDFTTAETLAALTEREPDPGLCRSVADIFHFADLVKFARFIPGPEAAAERLLACRDLAEAYQRRPEAAPSRSDEHAASGR